MALNSDNLNNSRAFSDDPDVIKDFRKKQKKLRVSGKCYTTQDKKKTKPAKEPPSEEVICKCKSGCTNVSAEMKRKLFHSYLDLGMNEQGSYLMNLIDILPIARRRHGEDAQASRRQSTLSYRIPDGQGDFTKVCKKTFLNIFSISPQKITTIVKKKKIGQVIFKDSRGGPKTFKFTQADRQLIKNHINTLPREEGHYCRAKSEKEYLSSDLNMSRLFAAFKVKHPESKVSEKFYRKVFLKDFPKLSFKRPRVDTCKTCDSLQLQCKIRDPAVANNAKKQLELHHRKAEQAFKTIKEDSTASTMPDSDTCSIVIDLQKVFPIPKLTHSDMYYLRQLSCYNFNIHVNDSNDGIMCVWHEGQSGRGGNQMASCILQAINTGMLSTYKKRLVIWSDNCAGQIKNRMLVFLYIYLVSLGIVDSIEHKFLVTGHSFSAADRDFAIIEKKAKVSKMQTVADVEKVISSARTAKPFNVLSMATFFNFEEASKKFIKTQDLKISKVSWLKVDKNYPGYVLYKKSFTQILDWEKRYVLKKRVSMQDIVSSELNVLPNAVTLSENKKKDLLSMMDFIDQPNREFFNSVLNN